MQIRTLSVCAVVFGLATAACGGDDDPSGPDQSVFGFWEEDGEGRFYVLLEPSQLTTFDEVEFPCHEVTTFTIEDRDGDVFTLSSVGGQGEVIIRRAGDGLTIEVAEGGGAQSFSASTIDPEALQQC